MVSVYGLKDRVKKDWLEILPTDTAKDEMLIDLLDQAAIITDNLAGAYGYSLPLTGTDLSDEVRRLNEKLTAGIYLSTQGKETGQKWVDESKAELKAYFERLKASTRTRVVSTDYMTAPLSDDEATELTET